MHDWMKLLVYPGTPIIETIAVIDNGAQQTALVVDEERRLVGIVSDGDIRRAILKGADLTGRTDGIMNATPVTMPPDMDERIILARMKAQGIRQIPIVDAKGRLVDFMVLSDLLNGAPLPNEVVLMAGGLGTRLGALTGNCPKPLLKVGSKPILETIIENFIEHGFRRFHLSVNYLSEMIEDYFGDGSRWGVSIDYLREKDRLGTAGALSLLPGRPEHPFFVMNGDILTKVNFRQMLYFHLQHENDVCMAVKEFSVQIPYGVVKIGNRQSIAAMEEKPTETFFVSAGIYLLNPSVLDRVPRNTFFDMPTLFTNIINDNGKVGAFPLREYWLDIGRIEDYERANGEFAAHFCCAEQGEDCP